MNKLMLLAGASILALGVYSPTVAAQERKTMQDVCDDEMVEQDTVVFLSRETLDDNCTIDLKNGASLAIKFSRIQSDFDFRINGNGDLNIIGSRFDVREMRVRLDTGDIAIKASRLEATASTDLSIRAQDGNVDLRSSRFRSPEGATISGNRIRT